MDKRNTMADGFDFETKLSFSQHLKEAEERLKEFGSVISNVRNHGYQDELIEQMNHIEADIDKKLETKENVTCNKQKAVQDLEAESDALSFKINSYKKSIKLLQEELSHLMKEKSLLNDAPDGDIMTTKIKQLEAEDLMFRKQLGVEIRKVKGGCLQISFNQIDHKQPNSLFLFSLKLDENRQYIISDCKPTITDVDNIVQQLNSDNDFYKFIRTMRQKFKECVA